MAEAEVVECDHPDEDYGERKHLLKVCMKDLLISFLVTCFNIEGSTVSSGKLTRFGSFVAAHLCKVKACTVGCFSKDTLKKNKKPNPVRN